MKCMGSLKYNYLNEICPPPLRPRSRHKHFNYNQRVEKCAFVLNCLLADNDWVQLSHMHTIWIWLRLARLVCRNNAIFTQHTRVRERRNAGTDKLCIADDVARMLVALWMFVTANVRRRDYFTWWANAHATAHYLTKQKDWFFRASRAFSSRSMPSKNVLRRRFAVCE